jgi:hypothetical protein
MCVYEIHNGYFEVENQVLNGNVKDLWYYKYRCEL